MSATFLLRISQEYLGVLSSDSQKKMLKCQPCLYACSVYQPLSMSAFTHETTTRPDSCLFRCLLLD